MARLATMKIWDVELGLSIHIEAPNGKYIVIDLGRKDNFSPLSKLQYKDVGYMVITHPHKDHIEDIANVNTARPDVLWRVHSFSRDELLMNAQNYSDRDIINRYCDFVEGYTGTLSNDKDPTTCNPFSGLTAQVFQTTLCGKSNINNFSAIVVLKLGSVKIVVCGDNESASFNHLMERDDFKEAIQNTDILVAAHHGRESGFHSDFVSLANPLLTVVSDTKNPDTTASNRYSARSRGLSVYDRWGNESIRKCLTTRSDGNIKIVFGEASNPQYRGTLRVETNA